MKYRDNGAIGALLDKYERSIIDLKKVIQAIAQKDLIQIVDHNTKDDDCRSIQTIMTHVIQSGYTYVIAIRKSLGENIAYKPKVSLDTSESYAEELDKMFGYTELLFKDFPDISLEEYEAAKKIRVRWGQLYDVDQLMEHAIVHILRHRRQIERFKIRLLNHNDS